MEILGAKDGVGRERIVGSHHGLQWAGSAVFDGAGGALVGGFKVGGNRRGVLAEGQDWEETENSGDSGIEHFSHLAGGILLTRRMLRSQWRMEEECCVFCGGRSRGKD